MPLRIGDARVAGERGHIVVADHLRQLDRGVVQRPLQRIACGHFAGSVMAVVARRIAAFEGLGVAVEQSDFGEEPVVQARVGGLRGRAVLRSRIADDSAIRVGIVGGGGIDRRGRSR